MPDIIHCTPDTVFCTPDTVHCTYDNVICTPDISFNCEIRNYAESQETRLILKLTSRVLISEFVRQSFCIVCLIALTV